MIGALESFCQKRDRDTGPSCTKSAGSHAVGQMVVVEAAAMGAAQHGLSLWIPGQHKSWSPGLRSALRRAVLVDTIIAEVASTSRLASLSRYLWLH
ncbi:hypothetical protein XH88_35325 [Bradyrhizobium sp. CCBAU 51627]|nr:hypothetical protein [Bradyrhizobium sp. CCBAU 51627]